MTFDLVKDFADVLDAMPREHPWYRILKLLDVAVRRDVHFIDSHPTTLFQCLWNTCWWYDCPEAAEHYDLSQRTGTGPLPWNVDSQRISELLEQWHATKQESVPGFVWLRSLRPPPVNLGAGQQLVLQGHTDWVSSVCFSPDGRQLASASTGQQLGAASRGKSIRVWDAFTGQELLRIRGHVNGINDVCFAPNGRWLASASNDRTVRLWDGSTGFEIRRFEGHLDYVKRVCFSPEGLKLVSASGDATLRVWDVESGNELLRIDHSSGLTSVCISPDGKRIASTTFEKWVLVWDAFTGEELLRFHAHPHPADDFGSSPFMFDARTNAHLEPVNDMRFSPDGQRIATASGDETIRLWNAETGNEVLCIHDEGDTALQLKNKLNQIESVCFSPDGQQLATGSWDERVHIWDAETGAELFRFSGHSSWVYGVCFSPDGRRVASASRDHTVRVWDLNGGELLTLAGHLGSITRLRFSADGRDIVSMSSDRTARTWDTSTGKCMGVREYTMEGLTAFPPLTPIHAWKPLGDPFDAGFADSVTGLVIATYPFVWKSYPDLDCYDRVLAWSGAQYVYLLKLEGDVSSSTGNVQGESS